MPCFRGITIKIHTPCSIDGLPETTLPAPALTSSSTEAGNKFASVYIAAQARALFWISYSAEAPGDESFFVLKLFINGEHILTWCCDKQGQWHGMVQFALFKKHHDDEVRGGAGMEKRVLQFGDVEFDHEDKRCIEVQVLRASGKTRMPRELGIGADIKVGNGIQLPEGGKTKRGHPRRYYQFRLIDPKEDPYATFRFYYRSSDELMATTRRPGDDDARRFVTRNGRTTEIRRVPTGKLVKSNGIRVSRLPQAVNRISTSLPSSSPPTPTVTTGIRVKSSPAFPSSTSLTPTHHIRPAIPRSTGQANLRRLSIPPSTILRPLLEHGPLPASPQKQAKCDESPKFDVTKANKENIGRVFRSLISGNMSRKNGFERDE